MNTVLDCTVNEIEMTTYLLHHAKKKIQIGTVDQRVSFGRHASEKGKKPCDLLSIPRPSGHRKWEVGELGVIRDEDDNDTTVVYWLNAPIMHDKHKNNITVEMWLEQPFLPVRVAMEDATRTEYYSIKPIPNYVRMFAVYDDVRIIYKPFQLTADHRLPNEVKKNFSAGKPLEDVEHV